eukprot:TRINITY_DN38816_c0_g1_i2.p1 TRINITY_DN38816_c0_g1~~TRINITY_DN38816_c0_g1_i2.p1  ORF type:complete len:367 (+),score=67.90 TRINITY_DN38816_c0_g1_i2:64-1101(+)
MASHARMRWVLSEMRLGRAAAVHISRYALTSTTKVTVRLYEQRDAPDLFLIETLANIELGRYIVSDKGHHHSAGHSAVVFYLRSHQTHPLQHATSQLNPGEPAGAQQASEQYTAEGFQGPQGVEGGAGPEGSEDLQGLSSQELEQELAAAKASLAEQLKELAKQQKEQKVAVEALEAESPVAAAAGPEEKAVPADTSVAKITEDTAAVADATASAKDAEEAPAIAADNPVAKSVQADPEAAWITNTRTSRPSSSSYPMVGPQKELVEDTMDRLKKLALKIYSFTRTPLHHKGKQTASALIEAELKELRDAEFREMRQILGDEEFSDDEVYRLMFDDEAGMHDSYG